MPTQQANKDVISTLLSQHEQVKSLFAQLSSATGSAAEAPFCELRRMLSVHETAEEEIVYPALRSTGDQGKQVADARIAEEGKAKEVLAKLEKMEIGSADFTREIAEFKKAVVEHATHEEAEVFPLLRQHLSESMLQKMGKALEVAEAAAPTHPHPHGPDSGIGNIVVGPAVAIMDRVRDALHKAR